VISVSIQVLLIPGGSIYTQGDLSPSDISMGVRFSSGPEKGRTGRNTEHVNGQAARTTSYLISGFLSGLWGLRYSPVAQWAAGDTYFCLDKNDLFHYRQEGK